MKAWEFDEWIIIMEFDNKEVVKMIQILEQRGQGLVEYALILVLVAIVVIIALAFFGTGVRDLFQTVINRI